MTMDGQPALLKVLLVEDSPADAELIVRALRDLPMPVDHTRVDAEPALRNALSEFLPHVILSDFAMPGFSGQQALQVVTELTPHIPLLFVSGNHGEELAIDALQRGAMDYILKSNLRRLPSAVVNALRTARDRRALVDSEARFRSIVEASQDWIWEIDTSCRVTYNNDAIASILGLMPEALLGRNALDHMLPEDRATVEQVLPELVAEGRGWRGWVLRWRHRNGSIRMLESTATPVLDAHGKVLGFRGVDHDITERLQQEARIQHLGRIRGVLAGLGNAILRSKTRDELLQQVCRVAVEEGRFEAACIGMPGETGALTLMSCHGNPAVTELIKSLCPLPPEGATGAQLRPGLRALREARNVIVRDFANADHVPEHMPADMARVGIAAQIALPLGSPPWGVLALYAVHAQEFESEEIAVLEQLAHEIDYAVSFLAGSERLQYLAYHNVTTGLLNRTAFIEKAGCLLENGPIVVAAVRCQRFAAFNESRGHAMGQEVMRQAGAAMQAAFGADAVVAHAQQGAFFLLAYRAAADNGEGARLGAKLQELGREPLQVRNENIFLSLEAGFALSPLQGENAATLEHNATIALGEAGTRKVRVHPYNDELRLQAARRSELEADLRVAVEQSQFELHYQPKFNTASQRLSGAEALLRWRHPRHGLVSPAEFIPILEAIGLIVPVGHWVMRTALETALSWREICPSGFTIAVNVSAREMQQESFLRNCETLLGPHAAAQLVDIEITESLLMEDVSLSIQILDGLRALGCRVALDDFGTGYSSLNYLARLPADILKIDQSFVARLTHGPETMGLVTNIIALAHSLSLKVVAEGVEEEEQAKLLRLLRCDEMQGYLFGRPMTATDFQAKFL